MPAAKPGEADLRTFIAPIAYPKRSKPPAGGSYPPPDYPHNFLRDHVEGLVIVEMTVAESGAVESAGTVLSSGHKALDQHTLDWVRKRWKFPPGKKRIVLWPAPTLFSEKSLGLDAVT